MRQRTYITLLFAFIFVLDSYKKGAPIRKTNSQDNTPVNGSTKAALQGTGYTFTKIFNVPSTENQQGLAFGARSHFVTFDIGSGQARIVQYNSSGAEIKRTGGLAMGHGAEVSYRQADGNLYIANGGLSGTPTYVYEVDMRLPTPVIARTIDFSSMGSNGMVAVDNGNGRLVVFAGPKGGPYTAATTDLDGTILSKFSIAGGLGTPQGIEMIGNEILYYTSKSPNNNIAVYSTTGTLLYSIPIPIADEGEGLSIDEATRTIYVGTHYPRRVYKMSPTFASDALLGINLIINPNAEGGAGGGRGFGVGAHPVLGGDQRHCYSLRHRRFTERNQPRIARPTCELLRRRHGRQWDAQAAGECLQSLSRQRCWSPVIFIERLAGWTFLSE